MFIIEPTIKKRIKNEIIHLIFCSILFLMISLPVFARPSFEIYPLGGHPDPDIEDISINKVNDSLVIIKARITDISSIYSARAIIKDSAGNRKETHVLYDDGSHQDEGERDSIYGAFILIDSYPLDTFTVDLFASDVFGNTTSLPDAGSFTTGGALSGYSYRRKITVQSDQIDSDLTDFPLLVSIPADIANKMMDNQNWNDIRFTASNGLTPLPYEKESMSASGGKYWVKIPHLYASPSEKQNQIFVYYGKRGEGDDSEPANVWDSNFMGVWHMHNTSSPATDSTINANNGTAFNGVTFSVTGKVDGATSYDGGNDYIDAGGKMGNFGTGPFSASIWVKRSAITSNYQTFISKDSGIPGWYVQFTNANKVRFGTRISGNANYLDSNNSITDTNWHYIVAIRDDSGNKRIYIDGSLNSNPAVHSVNVNSPANLLFGQIANQQYFNGFIDELRISNIARSAEWVKFEYANISQPDNELTWGREEEL